MDELWYEGVEQACLSTEREIYEVEKAYETFEGSHGFERDQPNYCRAVPACTYPEN